ncbi:MAG: Glu-tRNA(Gln) amidotransferase subunit GatE [Acidobacteria bacterium]|nr:Glu-tRNA(Gln) amidotransferase subunit GatE [Acidobacteriota bacterium]
MAPASPASSSDAPDRAPVAGTRPRSREDEVLDYAGVGLIAGLEVHQQLLTERKLFCQCPAGRYTRTHDGTVLRHMRPTLSELGVYDGTALMEFKTRKHIVYLLNRENTCTYEMDDTPPFPVNQKAVDVAIEQCLMLGCDIVDEVHIARKQYLDGSIPTGFQRTAIVGVNGRLPFRGRTLTITQVSVEEDSCREVSDRGHLIVWRTDRLGMPLIETVTAPDLRTPDEVEEAILLVGRVCRSTGHVRVGLGASRQDVNVSVRGGRRVEIKGVPRAGWAPALVHGEGVRQTNLLRLRDELHRRGLTRPDAIGIETTDVTDLFASSRLEPLRRDAWERFVSSEGRRPEFELGEGAFRVLAVRLPGLGDTLSWPTQPGRTFAHELAGRVRVVSGLDQPPILFHSEDWPTAARDELDALRMAVQWGPDDGLVVVWGPEADTRTAAEEIRIRYADATEGVPHETRQPFPDGSTDFERILPGPDRMYPDTDSPPTRVTRERVERLRETLSERPWEREARYADAGVPTSTVHYLIRRGGAARVDQVVRDCGADLRFAAFFFGERLKGLRRSGVAVHEIPEERWCELFRAFLERPARHEAWAALVTRLADEPWETTAEALRALGLDGAPAGWRDRLTRWLDDAAAEVYDDDPGRLVRHATGRVMSELRGRVPARSVVEAVRTALEAGR